MAFPHLKRMREFLNEIGVVNEHDQECIQLAIHARTAVALVHVSGGHYTVLGSVGFDPSLYEGLKNVYDFTCGFGLVICYRQI